MTVLYTTFEDVATAYEGSIPAADQARVESLIRRASARLTHIVPSAPPRLVSGDLDPDLPAGLVIEAVLRVYRNPEGVTEQAIGPFHKQFNAKEVAAEIQFDEVEVHAYLDPIPNYVRPSIRVGFPTPRQQRGELAGQHYPPPDLAFGDDLGLSDVVTAVSS